MRALPLLALGILLATAAQPASALREVKTCSGMAPLTATCTLQGFSDVDWVIGVFFEPRPYVGIADITIDGSNGGHERWWCVPYGPNAVACQQMEQGAFPLGDLTVRLVAGFGWLPGVGNLPATVPAVGPWQLYLYLY